MTRRRLLKFVLPVVAVLAAAGIALAFWSSTGTGPSDGIAVASLPGPANVTATVTPGQSTVSVDWDAAQLSSGDDPEGYRVTKTDGSNATTDACGTDANTLITSATDCSDTSVPDGVYTYKVIAVYHSFTGTGTAAAATHVATETDAPSATLTFPADGSTYAAAGFDNGCTTAGFCGTASDTGTGASGVHTVQAEIQQVSSSKYYDGSGFNDSSEHYLAASFDSGTGNWTFGFDHTKLPAEGNYTVSVKATDWGGNVSSVVSHTFTYDTTAPSISSLAMKDTNGNGKVDQVVATFDEPISSSTATAPWHLSNVPSGGSLSSVSTSGSSATLTIAEGSGAADTSVGSFTVSLDASATGIHDAAGNQSSFSAQAPSDQAAPARTGMVMKDTNGNGKVDEVDLTFSESLASYSAANSVWTLANVPSGGSLNNVNVSGSSATLSLNEGSGAADTSLGTFTVALAADANGIRDAAGNQSSFAAAGPTDGAAPVRISMAMFDTTGNGKVDRVQVVYSEALANYTAGNTPWNLKNVPSGGSLASVARGSGSSQNILTLTITEGSGAADTSVGSFTVAYTAGSTAARDATSNQAVSFGDTAPLDAAAPVRTSMVMQDLDGNGKVDRVAMTFSENLASYTAPNSVWTLTSAPGGATLNTVDVSGSSVNLNLNEGSVATGVGSFTVALGANAAGIRDAADNRTSFVAAAPTDGAAPIRTGLSAQDGDSNGTIDKIVATYSESVASTTDAGLWTFSGTTPGGGSKGTVSSTGNAVTINITGASVNTAVPGDFQVAYTAGGTGVKDSSANANQAASAGAAAPTDAALPIRTSMEMQDQNANGKVDAVVSTYSETVQNTTDATAWAFSGTVPSTGTKGSVSTSGNQVTVAVNEGSGAADTSVGTFKVAYTASGTAVTDSANNQAATIAATAPTDKAAPIVTKLEMFDNGAGTVNNGKVDKVIATYSENLGAATSDATLWTLSNVPSAGAKGTVSGASGGNTVTVNITEGSGAADTSNAPGGTPFTVAYASGSAGVKDAANNLSPAFGATQPADKAAPVPVSITDSDTGATTDGKFAAGDSMTVTFSENIQGLPSTSTVTLTDKGAGGQNDGVAMTGLISGTANLNASGYITNAGTGIATFGPSTVTQTAGNSTFTVTLGTQGNTGVPTQPTAAALFSYVPATTITDSSSNQAVAPATLGSSFTIKLF